MNELRKDLPPIPDRMLRLAIDHRGYPIPRFVEYVDGKPDFRVMDAAYLVHCVKFRTCWICSGKLGAIRAFVIGPMCAVNRVSSEPPSHRDCAVFAAKACPFLTMPKAKRREAGLPEHKPAAGVSIPRNPGVALVWITRGGRPFNVGRNGQMGMGRGILFEVGEPLEALWFAEGREATRAEVMASIESGFPELQRMAEEDGQAAMDELLAAKLRVAPLLPAEAR